MTRAQLNLRILGDRAVKAQTAENELHMKVAHARLGLISLSEALDIHGLPDAARAARAILETLQ